MDKTKSPFPKEQSNTSSKNTCREQPCQAGEDDCAQIPRDRDPGRPDPTETPKDCPLDHRDMRKLLDLQMVTYNTLLTTHHFIHCLHILPHVPILSLQARNRQKGKSLLVTASSQSIRCSASPSQHPQLTHHCIPSHFSVKTGWCLGLLMQSSRQDCSLPGADSDLETCRAISRPAKCHTASPRAEKHKTP